MTERSAARPVPGPPRAAGAVTPAAAPSDGAPAPRPVAHPTASGPAVPDAAPPDAAAPGTAPGRFAELDGRPVTEHVAVFEAEHDRLQRELGTIDQL